jgi:hypothetical protein
VWAYVFGGANGTAAAQAAGYSDASEACKVRAHGLLQRDDIQDAIAALCRKYLFSLAPKAILRLEEMLDNPRHPQHQRAVDSLLNRTGHAEKSAVDVNVEMKVTDRTAEAIATLRHMIELGVPEAKQIEVMGFSGYGRYLRLMQEEDAKGQPKLIESTATEIPSGAVPDAKRGIQP